MKTKQLLAMLIKAESILTQGDLLCEVTAASILRGCIATLAADIAKPVEPVAAVQKSALFDGNTIVQFEGVESYLTVGTLLYTTPQEPAVAAIPEGWKLVPIEPNDTMQAAGAQAVRFDTTVINKIWTGNAVYRAMLAAAPENKT
jgi:hypothetical protein